jgi:hypothetical protein
MKNYEHQPQGIYTRQRANARRRDIPFDLTFEQWWKIWQDSGLWELRGVGRERACMSRINDEGGYSLGNVEIKLQWENRQEYLQRRWNRSDPFRTFNRAVLPPEEAAWTYKT